MADYQIKQFNYIRGSGNVTDFMTLQTGGIATRKTITKDYHVEAQEAFIFEDEALNFNFESNIPYYFHGRIKRMKSSQTFFVRLINDKLVTDPEFQQQYITTLIVAPGTEDITSTIQPEWVNVEFIFIPQTQFSHMVFQLQRDSSDYREETRYPLIAYQELSKVENLLKKLVNNNENLIKIGVQSRPGLMMCINNQEIRTSKTGIYELKNGIVTISSFSVCNAAKEANDTLNQWMSQRDEEIYIIDQETKTDYKESERRRKALTSQCFFNTPKTRTIDSFTLDYLYKEIEI